MNEEQFGALVNRVGFDLQKDQWKETFRLVNEAVRAMELQISELQTILYRARWHVSTDNFCDCHARYGEPHKNENCLLLTLASAVEKSPKCCPPFEPGKEVHSEFCRNDVKPVQTPRKLEHCKSPSCVGADECLCQCHLCLQIVNF